MRNFYTTDNIHIFPKKCDNFKEIDNSTIDIIITSPPYNIKHKYVTYSDNLRYEEYIEMLRTFVCSSFRVLKKNGLLIIDFPIFIFQGEKIFTSAKFLEKECRKANLFLSQYYFYMANEDNSFLGMHVNSNLNGYLPNINYCHSPIQCIMIFSKNLNIPFPKRVSFESEYSYYGLENNAFWPDKLVNDFIENFHLVDKNVLDPFMGSGVLGLKSILNGCKFWGYEIEDTFCNNFINKVKSYEGKKCIQKNI